MPARVALRGVVFDMDGTLTVPVIDFAAMRRRVGATSHDLLAEIAAWPPARQEQAYRTITAIEMEAKENMRIMPVQAAPFAPALSREFLPYKPDPAPLLHICNAWSVLPTEVLMIGDSVKDDIVCGRRAGASTCHLDSSCQFPAEAADPKRRATPCQEANQEQEPDFRIASLTQLQELLETHFDLPPPLSC
eukprot:SM000070S21356  [mRNA]  locus=s70:623539:625164:+ [translate_table: standard]